MHDILEDVPDEKVAHFKSDARMDSLQDNPSANRVSVSKDVVMEDGGIGDDSNAANVPIIRIDMEEEADGSNP
ncbi:hypothetical protein BGZ65_007663 [Modicella reniformis]|uniref:Uncharacterized protein n=1 Tax=Modicella reniformis TaxID=1440133 RepID=A0A9P6MFC6_9FUNG|nr:hypothetical protein BGZ65_007663 [Modicella reniformis]